MEDLNGAFYDLSQLRRHDHNYRVSHATDHNSTFLLNVCGPLVTQDVPRKRCYQVIIMMNIVLLMVIMMMVMTMIIRMIVMTMVVVIINASRRGLAARKPGCSVASVRSAPPPS